SAGWLSPFCGPIAGSAATPPRFGKLHALPSECRRWPSDSRNNDMSQRKFLPSLAAPSTLHASKGFEQTCGVGDWERANGTVANVRSRLAFDETLAECRMISRKRCPRGVPLVAGTAELSAVLAREISPPVAFAAKK